MSKKSTIKHYIELTKPKIIFGNITSTIGGFFMASEGNINIHLLLTTILGISLVIAANGVINNIIDKNIDSLMTRTKNRVLVKKIITWQHAFIYANILFFGGFYILLYTTNSQVICLTIISSFVYIVIYSLLMKKKSIYSVLIGSISGSIPPVIGYCSKTNTLDLGAYILMILFIVWQIAHSYSIIIFRFKDYQYASVPTFPSKKGITLTQQHIKYSIILFMIHLILLTLNQYTSYTFLLLMETLTGGWLYIAYQGDHCTTHNNITQWSKKMFITSVIIIMFFNIGISIDSLYT